MHFFLPEFKLHTMLQKSSWLRLAYLCILTSFRSQLVKKNQTEAYDQRTIDLKSTLVSPCQYIQFHLSTIHVLIDIVLGLLDSMKLNHSPLHFLPIQTHLRHTKNTRNIVKNGKAKNFGLRHPLWKNLKFRNTTNHRKK